MADLVLKEHISVLAIGQSQTYLKESTVILIRKGGDLCKRVI
ncbi:Uncharacterised protein [Yersinia mollaretii]|uniref:Uncharacterized protein n=1 Tax=Yersinia mollaretii TaxID=33060 RepID=A0AA36LME9_YERMO|nr:Uncharacterised protein [Yersinia mollaretii]